MQVCFKSTFVICINAITYNLKNIQHLNTQYILIVCTQKLYTVRGFQRVRNVDDDGEHRSILCPMEMNVYRRATIVDMIFCLLS